VKKISHHIRRCDKASGSTRQTGKTTETRTKRTQIITTKKEDANFAAHIEEAHARYKKLMNKVGYVRKVSNMNVNKIVIYVYIIG
jgi:hypothetical protein